MSSYFGSSEGGKLKTPDINPAQAVAIVGALLAVIVAAGLGHLQGSPGLDHRPGHGPRPILLISDAAIRHGRSRAFLNAPKPIEDKPVESKNPMRSSGGA